MLDIIFFLWIAHIIKQPNLKRTEEGAKKETPANIQAPVYKPTGQNQRLEKKTP